MPQSGLTRVVKTILFFFILAIIALIFSPKEIAAANQFNGDVVDAATITRLVPLDVEVACGSGCVIQKWEGDHFNAVHEGVGKAFSVQLVSFPNKYESCTFEILDRGPDINDESDFAIIVTGEGCLVPFTPFFSNDWRYSVRFLLHLPDEPPPEPDPDDCAAPQLEPVELVECTDEENARLLWLWSPKGNADTYRLQVAFDSNFSNLETDRKVGSINFYTGTITDPLIPRFSRVRVEDTVVPCAGEWLWSYVVVSIFDCTNKDDDNGDSSSPPLVFNIFCTIGGYEPTDDPASGKIYSAIGCIPVNDTNLFIAFVLRWSIAVAGGIAFLLIIYASFMMMTSRGDPKKIQAAKELLTSSITGLVLLIFSIFVLELFGVSILNIPGF